MIAIGDPVATYAPGDPSLPEAIEGVGFAGRAFGVSTAWEDRIARHREIAEVRSKEFGARTRRTRRAVDEKGLTSRLLQPAERAWASCRTPRSELVQASADGTP